ncbi:MAG TPA: hypothetical protein VFD30_20250 [Terriglobia bacterium]|jgi:hypothetical protein|nr:hypothetical protein [Terriglobia bacterium]
MAELTATPVSRAPDSMDERERRPSYAPPSTPARTRSPRRESQGDPQQANPAEENEHQLDIMA